jgi:putative MATE family efflux protein
MTSPAMLQAPVNRTLKNMTLPMMFGLVMLMSFNLVDTYYVSLLGTQSLAAFSFTFPVTFTVISLAIGLGVGVSAVVAKTLGQQDKLLARQQASIALILAAFLIYILALIILFFMGPLFRAMGASGLQIELISHYMLPWLLGSLLIIMPMIGNSVMRASGDTKTPAKIMAIGALINAVLDPLFIFGYGPVPAMGITGAAVASILASSISCMLVFYRLRFSYDLLGWGGSHLQMRKSARQVLSIGLPAAASNMMTPISTSILIAMVAQHGAEAVAAFGVGSRIESFAIILVLALSMSLPPFVSQNFGAGQFLRVKQAYFNAISFAIVWQLLIYVLLWLCADKLAQLFAKDPEVVKIITLYLAIIPLAHGLVGITILSNSSLNALHKPMISLGLNVMRLFVFLLPCAYIGAQLGELMGMIIGIAVAAALSGVLAFYMMTKQLAKLSSKGSDL